MLVPGGDAFGASWASDGWIYYSNASPRGLYRVRPEGGQPEALLLAPKASLEIYTWPELLPGGEAVVFTTFPGWDDPRLDVLFLKSRERRTLLAGASQARSVPTGHLVYIQNGKLLAAPFDGPSLRLGPGVRVLDDVLIGIDAAYYTFSQNGTLVYIPGKGDSRADSLVWVDRQGRASPVADKRERYVGPKISPDGTQITVCLEAFPTSSGVAPQAIVHDTKRGTDLRISEDNPSMWPMWSADGRRLFFTAHSQEGGWDIFSRPADASAPAERLTGGGAVRVPFSVTSDGQSVVFQQSESVRANADIWVLSLAREYAARPLRNTKANEWYPALSPDGKWLAYASDESGSPQVYVTPFPGPGPTIPVSTEGGLEPAWNPKGGELFFRSDNFQRLYSERVETAPRFHAERPVLLFEGPYAQSNGYGRSYDVAPDGSRFLMVLPARPPVFASRYITVVNWFEELESKVGNLLSSSGPAR